MLMTEQSERCGHPLHELPDNPTSTVPSDYNADRPCPCFGLRSLYGPSAVDSQVRRTTPLLAVPLATQWRTTKGC